MATPTDFPEANGTLGAPEDMPDCTPLRVHMTADGRRISCWELTDDELMMVLQTKRVWLTVWGGHPAVCVEGTTPFLSGR